MRLTPTPQTEEQIAALRCLLDYRKVNIYEPCDCGSQIRHNNGGNYHLIVGIRLDAGKVFRSQTLTGDYSPPFDWVEVKWAQAIEEIADRAADGWRILPAQ